MKKIIIAYIPVIHDGYMRFLRAFSGSENILYVLGDDLFQEFCRREIRAMHPIAAKNLIASLGFFGDVRVLERRGLEAGIPRCDEIIFPDEYVSRCVAENYFKEFPVSFHTVFLRWDEGSVKKVMPAKFDRKSCSAADISFMDIAHKEGAKSSDWWRHVGAVLVKDGEILLCPSHNQHVPSDHTPYIDGDPRDVIEAGKDSHMGTAIHAEQWLIAKAACRGIPLEGVDIYSTVFPCPMCVRSIAVSGIKRCFFSEGHTSLDGETILKSAGVELIFVQSPS